MLGGLTAPFPFLFPFPEAVTPPSGLLQCFLPSQESSSFSFPSRKLSELSRPCNVPPPRYPIFLLEEEQFSGLTLCARLQPSPG